MSCPDGSPAGQVYGYTFATGNPNFSPSLATNDSLKIAFSLTNFRWVGGGLPSIVAIASKTGH